MQRFANPSLPPPCLMIPPEPRFLQAICEARENPDFENMVAKPRWRMRRRTMLCGRSNCRVWGVYPEGNPEGGVDSQDEAENKGVSAIELQFGEFF